MDKRPGRGNIIYQPLKIINMYNSQQINERAEQIARKKDPFAYHMRADPEYSLIWRARVAEAYHQACIELHPPNVRRKWAFGRFLVLMRKQFPWLFLPLE